MRWWGWLLLGGGAVAVVWAVFFRRRVTGTVDKKALADAEADRASLDAQAREKRDAAVRAVEGDVSRELRVIAEKRKEKEVEIDEKAREIERRLASDRGALLGEADKLVRGGPPKGGPPGR